LDGELTIENLQAFIAAFEENTLTPLDIVPVVFDGTVANITSQDFDFIVRSSPYDVLVEFYAPWCGHWYP
jgi:protein disulfide-isomerase A1